MRAVPVVLVLVASGLLSGCLSGVSGALEHDPVPAPAWEPGFWWTYDVARTSSGQFGQTTFGGPEAGRPESMTMRVFNTSEPFLGRPAYYLHVDRPLSDLPIWDASILAFDQATLSTLGSGNGPYPEAENFYYSPSPAYGYLPHVSESGSIAPEAYWDPCQDRQSIWPVESEDRFYPFRFPMDDGDRWGGSFRPLGDIPYQGRVRGLEAVQTGSGWYDAVHSVIEFGAPGVEAALEYQGIEDLEMQLRIDQWYAPEVRWIVKSVMQMHVSGLMASTGDVFRVDVRIDLVLAEHSLRAGPAAPAPYAMPPATERSQVAQSPVLNIVTKTHLPVDLSGDPTNFTFGAQMAPKIGGYLFTTLQEDDPGAMPYEYNRSTHRLIWRLDRDTPHFETQWGQGDTFRVALDGPGYTWVSVRLAPIACGYSGSGWSSATVPGFWQRDYLVPVVVMQSSPVLVADLMLPGAGAELKATWSFRRSTVTSAMPDQGQPMLRDAEGRSTYLGSPSSTSGNYHLDGDPDWRLFWAPAGNVVLGDDVDLRIHVDYTLG